LLSVSSSLPFSWLPFGSILPSIVHGKFCNDALLQLIDCIESMKNEVKKKMHEVQRAMLYQSHTAMREVKKNFLYGDNS